VDAQTQDNPQLTRRDLLSGALAPLALGACGSRRSSSSKRPNILFALADDQSWPHAGAYRDKAARTPAFDRIAGEGVLFTNSFCASPSCTPSRSAILAGRNIWQLEEAGVLYGTIPRKFPLFPHLLEDAGYHVGFTGKGWGPGNWKAGGLDRVPTGKEYNSRLHAGPLRDGIDRRDYAANFEDFLKARPAGTPFCFWFGSTEPHRPYGPGVGLQAGRHAADVVPPPFLPDSDGVRHDILDYYSEIDWFDAELARILAGLKAAGELDNTLIVVTSDNGMPFPRAKCTLYDWGTHMPLAIRWGSRVRGGRVVDDLVSHTDFAPTILEAAGVALPPGITGRSLLPILDSGKSGIVETGRDRVYTALERHTWCRPDGATYPMRALRTRRSLYIRNFTPDRWPTGGPDFVSSNKTFHGDVDGAPTKDFMLLPENRKKYPREFELCFGKRPAEELYEVALDPCQTRNLAADPAHQEELRRCRSELETYLRQTRDPRIEGRDPWQAYTYHQTVGFGATFNKSLSEEQRREARERAAHKPE
jgi:N-sulfoglucosamine sulfohydrolase